MYFATAPEPYFFVIVEGMNGLNNDILKDQNSKVKLVLSYLGLCVESWNSSFKGKKCIVFYYIFLKLGEVGLSRK